MQSSVGTALEPALLYEPAIPAGRNFIVPALAHERPDLTHALAIPDLRERVVPQISDDFLSSPVVDTHQDVAVVQNARDRKRNGTMAKPQLGCATLELVQKRLHLARDADPIVEMID